MVKTEINFVILTIGQTKEKHTAVEKRLQNTVARGMKEGHEAVVSGGHTYTQTHTDTQAHTNSSYGGELTCLIFMNFYTRFINHNLLNSEQS